MPAKVFREISLAVFKMTFDVRIKKQTSKPKQLWINMFEQDFDLVVENITFTEDISTS